MTQITLQKTTKLSIRRLLLICTVLLLANVGLSQSTDIDFEHSNKGRIYAYWGWNWSWYTKSTINFTGTDYDFTLHNATAQDRQSTFTVDKFLNPANATIPQYNFRIGYYFDENWDYSFGIDHMKYVLEQNQEVEISGFIDNTPTAFNGEFNRELITVEEDFLKFEHSDGLNYANFELRHTDKLLNFGKTEISLMEGIGAGILLPRTNTTILGNERYDEFHLSGYGVGAVLGSNVTFFNKVFIQTEVRGGYINLPDIRTTRSETDRASQDFLFAQYNVLFGGKINLAKKNKK